VDDPDLKELITRIRDHEIYHDEVFSDLLDEVSD
jgi:rubrerythrin